MQLMVHPQLINTFMTLAARGRAVQDGTQPISNLTQRLGLGNTCLAMMDWPHTYPAWCVFLLTCSTKAVFVGRRYMSGVDLGGIPLSRAPQIFRRNTIFAGTVIRPDYQFLQGIAAILVPGFRASTILTHMFKQIKRIRITLMAMFKVHPGSPKKEVHSVPVGLQLICTQRRGTPE